jgi:hypothetical protein
MAGIIGEVGSGSGIQIISAVLLNDGITRAIGIEIDERARQLSRFNAQLNGVAKRVVITKNDLETVLNGNKFSAVFMNPPFILAPETAKDYLIKAGWGGEDGLRITMEFIRIVENHIADNGQIVIYSQFAGDKKGITSFERGNYSKQGFNVKFEHIDDNLFDLSAEEWVDYIARCVGQYNPDVSESTIAEIEKSTGEVLDRQGFSGLYSGFIVMTKSDETAEGSLMVSDYHLNDFSEYNIDPDNSKTDFIRDKR